MELTADRGQDNIVTADDCETSKRSNARDFSGNDEGMEESLRKLLHLYPVVDTHLDAKEEEMSRRQTYLCGLVLVAVGGLSFIVSIYAIVLSKLMPPTGYWLLDAIREDHHFCYLVPLTIYPSCAAVYLSWVSLKFFRHN